MFNKGMILGAAMLACLATVGGTEPTYAADTTASEHVTLTIANEGENKPLTSFIGAGVYEPGQKAKIESKKGNKEFYGFWENKPDDSGLYEKKFTDETLETNMLADRELVPDCADHYSVHYSGPQLCTGQSNQAVDGYYYYSEGYGKQLEVTQATGITQSSAFNTTHCMNSALTTSKSGYYKLVSQTAYAITGYNDKNFYNSKYDAEKHLNPIGTSYSYSSQGGAASFSPNPIPVGRRGDVTVNVS